MKRFLDLKMWGYLLMMALCVSFTACSEDDDEGGPGGGNGNGHWGSSVQWVDDEGDSGNSTFTYDNQGRIIKIVDIEAEYDEEWITTYFYETDKITQIEKETGDDWYYKTVYYLNNKGLIVSSKSEEHMSSGQIYYDTNEYFEYDEQNKLIRRGREYDNTIDWKDVIWENENIVSDSYSTNIISYTNKADVRGINGMTYGFTDAYSFLYASGYWGKKSANLIESDGESTYSYTFEGDKVKTMTVDYGSGTERYTFNY